MATVRKDVAIADYEHAVQQAFREVADALDGKETLAREAQARSNLGPNRVRPLCALLKHDIARPWTVICVILIVNAVSLSRVCHPAIRPITSALIRSMKKPHTSGTIMKACGALPYSLVTALMLAIAVAVDPRVMPPKPAQTTVAS